ncbi:(deoxy)nucleoside triphosphate pyrophosphohydrolase [Endozoicomonas sp.]|nr:(deoxy)nucleoside triphosphate pyrophosphohydrolase [Endozoicomonas sp.]
MKKHIHVVGAIIANHAGSILCALRSPSMTLPNLWEFPGGKIEPSEKPQESLIREIQEELGCTIAVGNEVDNTTYEYEQFIVTLCTYQTRIVSGKPEPKEHAALLWLPKESLLSLHWAPADIPAVEKVMVHDCEPDSV